MITRCAVLLACAVLLGIAQARFFPEASYAISQNYTGDSFFDDWTFFTANDPTHGYVNYVDKTQAMDEGLISTSPAMVYIRADSTNKASGRGRDSVRITTNTAWDNDEDHLFVMDLAHMPAGCGDWPAWWLVGPNWPDGGEVDIIEGVNNGVQDTTTLHTDNGCDQSQENPNSFSGHWGTGSNNQPATNCYINAPNQYDNQGCGIVAATNTFGAPFNSNGGGVFVTEWTSTFIRMFFFNPNQVPSDLIYGKPDPTTWGKPYAYFTIGSNCPKSHFNKLQMVINLTFCGDWAGAVFNTDCPNLGACNSYVQNNPTLFRESYWAIRYVSVYHK